MKSQALQELVKKIFGDEETKSRFVSDPNSVLSEFTLTEPEKKAVLNTHTKLGLVSSNSQHLEAVLEPTLFWNEPVP